MSHPPLHTVTITTDNISEENCTFFIWIFTLEDGTDRLVCPQTSVRNYQYPLRNNPGEHSSHILRGRSLKSDISELNTGCTYTPYVSQGNRLLNCN